MRFRCLDYILKAGADRVGVPYLPDRIAQLTRPHAEHPPCHYCGNCSSGCDTGSFFSPTWFTLPDAERTGRLELRTNAIVRHVLTDDRGYANGVAYVERDTRRDVEVRARAVVLAASCMETAHIMLNSRSDRWPDGIGNRSGQLGRNLCDHLYGTAAYGCLPQLVGREPFPDNVSASTIAWMPRWQNLENPRDEAFVRGYAVYPGGGCGGFPYYFRQFEGFGSEYKKRIKDYYPGPVGFTIQAPSLPSPDNYVDIDSAAKDPFGIPVLRFHFRWGRNELLMWEHAKQVCAEVLRAAGGEYWGAGDKPETPGYSQHETGVCRFGNDPKRFVTNRWGQCHEVPTLYVCDAGLFPFPTDKTTTISILAFTLRACEHLIEYIRTR
jgi:choline dehydrogenase-like flavoprotein